MRAARGFALSRLFCSAAAKRFIGGSQVESEQKILKIGSDPQYTWFEKTCFVHDTAQSEVFRLFELKFTGRAGI
jgi:hypothetical protein